jgi:hypothetical protein
VVLNGQCVPSGTVAVPPVCANGTHLFVALNLCIPDACLAASSASACSACVNAAFNLISGACIPKACPSGQYYSVALAGCTPLPAQCAAFSLVQQSCTSCSAGFFLYGSLCIQPANSANCLTWDFNQNLCSACAAGYVWELNLCRLSGYAQGPCPAGQSLVAQRCYTLPANCLALNSVLWCEQCAQGFSVQAGQCLPCNGPNAAFPCAACPLGYFLNSFGNCVAANENCASRNDFDGSCLTCVNGDAPIGGKCCPTGQTLVGGVCSSGSAGGQLTITPAEYNRRHCETYDSQLSECVKCLSGYRFVSRGLCGL